MYTDVTDVYRIGRAGRLRTDLGGIYFNVVFMLAMAAAYFATGQAFFLAAVYLGHFEILEQLMPAVRLDGYYILGDLAGVPDLYGKIKPILLGLVPGRRGRAARAEVAELKRSARAVVATWVLTMVPLILGELGYALWNLPRIVATMLRSLAEQITGTGGAFAHGELAAGLMGVVGCVMLLCPMAGVVYLSVKVGGRLWRGGKRMTAGRPGLRWGLCVVLLAGLGGLSYAWVSGMTPEPLPKKPPIAPLLQPGVPTSKPPARQADVPGTPDGGAAGGVSPGAVPAEPGGAGGSAAAVRPSGSPRPRGSRSPRASASRPPREKRRPGGRDSASPAVSEAPPTGPAQVSSPTPPAPTATPSAVPSGAESSPGAESVSPTPGAS